MTEPLYYFQNLQVLNDILTELRTINARLEPWDNYLPVIDEIQVMLGEVMANRAASDQIRVEVI